MPGASIITIKGREIVFVDYSHCKPSQLRNVLDAAVAIVKEQNKPCLVLNNLEHTFVTPEFMRYAETEVGRYKNLIKKNSFYGLSLPKRAILRAFSLLLGRDYRAFETEEEAIEYLLDDDYL